jgi:flagellar biosynthesis protein FliQ
MLWYVFSWFLNFLLIAVIVGIIVELLKIKIEEHQTLSAFLIFFLPTFLEVASYAVLNRPFVFNLVG